MITPCRADGILSEFDVRKSDKATKQRRWRTQKRDRLFGEVDACVGLERGKILDLTLHDHVHDDVQRSETQRRGYRDAQ